MIILVLLLVNQCCCEKDKPKMVFKNIISKFLFFSENGQNIININKKHIQVWNSENFFLIKEIKLSYNVKFCNYPNQIYLLIYFSDQNKIKIFDLNYNCNNVSNKIINDLQWNKNCFISHNGNHLVYFDQQKIIISNLKNNQYIFKKNLKYKSQNIVLNQLFFNYDHKYMMFVDYKKFIIELFDLTNNKNIKNIFLNNNKLNYLKFFQNNMLFTNIDFYQDNIVAIVFNNKYKIYEIINISDGSLINLNIILLDNNLNVGFCSNVNFIAYKEGSLFSVWDVKNKKKLIKGKFYWNFDYNRILTIYNNKEIIKYNSDMTEKFRHQLSVANIKKAYFSLNSVYLICVNNNDEIIIFDVNSGKHLRTIVTKQKNIVDLKCNTDTSLIATYSSDDKTIKMWNLNFDS